MTDIVERLLLIAAWRKPGGPTPKESMPNTYTVATEAAEALTAKDAEIARLREALERIRDYAPEVTHGWALAIRTFARQAIATDSHLIEEQAQ